MHHCDNPPCFLYEHLDRATQSDNIQDAIAKGRHRYVAHRGEANGGGGKLTADQVAEIRRRWRKGTRYPEPSSSGALAREFGVNTNMILRIGNGQAWR